MFAKSDVEFYKCKAMLIQVMFSEAFPDPPTLIWWERGGLWYKHEPLLSIEQCHAPCSISVVSMGIVVINCIRSANYFSHDCRFTSVLWVAFYCVTHCAMVLVCVHALKRLVLLSNSEARMHVIFMQCRKFMQFELI